MTSTTKMISLADLIPANERPEDIQRQYGRHTVHEMPSRSFLLRHPDPRYGMMESCVMSWTPGVLTIGGDLGDLVLSHRAFETLEGGLSWLSRSHDIQYLASKSNARKGYQADAARALIVDDLLTGLRDELHERGLVGTDNQIPDPLPADFGWDDVQPWVRLAENYGIPLDEFLTASGREEALRMVLNEEEFGEPSQFAAFYSEIFGDDEVPYSGSHDYEPTVIRRIQMARAFATVILATPEFAPKEEEPAPEPAPMP